MKCLAHGRPVCPHPSLHTLRWLLEGHRMCYEGNGPYSSLGSLLDSRSQIHKPAPVRMWFFLSRNRWAIPDTIYFYHTTTCVPHDWYTCCECKTTWVTTWVKNYRVVTIDPGILRFFEKNITDWILSSNRCAKSWPPIADTLYGVGIQCRFVTYREKKSNGRKHFGPPA